MAMIHFMDKRVFIVRPFGMQEDIDFDAVERNLIQPAIKRVKTAMLAGGTTLPFVEQGNIREDMFRELVTADLVVADLSIHNANVFYELGIRHGMRPNATFLLRAKSDRRYPFDLQTDRYLTYDAAKPEEAVEALAQALDATLNSGRTDSPVYQLLPNLRAPDPATLRVVPSEFGEAVDLAREAQLRGDLRLLAHEARGFPWATLGLRAVGRAQFFIKATPGAIETFEWLRALSPNDVEANQRLATLYQRLAKDKANADEFLTKSNTAIQRVIDSPEPNSWDMAEAYALKARNLKARWLKRLEGKTAADVQIAALQSSELEAALETYASGFAQDRNHFYSGLNALSLLRIRIDLAQAQPDEWSATFESNNKASEALEALESRARQLADGVELAIEAKRLALARQRTPDPETKLWTEISAADFVFLSATRPRVVAQQYRQALSDAPSFAVDAVRDQIKIFERLGLRLPFVAAALSVTGPGEGGATPVVKKGRVLLFTGHRIDAEGRGTPRFPRTAEAEARRMIREAVIKERELGGDEVMGIAGGACGGDILFHEVCEEIQIPTRLFLAVTKDLFVESVRQGGPGWVERFNKLCARVPPRELGDSIQVPVWLRSKSDYSIWQRSNLWMLFNALALDLPLTLLALWDRGPADGPGGTQDLVAQVDGRGQKVVRLQAERLRDIQ
jgi:Tetratricopeptide Repeats-Sensor